MKPVTHIRTFVGVYGILLSLFACVDPIDLDIPEINSFLVVDGLITDLPGPYEVKLSLSGPLSSNDFIQVEGAEVRIEEENGVVEILTEEATGLYRTSETGIRGRAGNRYKLYIRLPEGQQYTTDWQLLKAAPPIEEVYYQFERRDRPDGRLERGTQIYLSTVDPQAQTQFYRWEWEATWLHVAPFSSGLKFLGNDEAEFVGSNTVCYNTTLSSNINIGSSLGNTNDQISDFPLLFVSTFGMELMFRYSILVKQYALTEEEYFFWTNLEEANENSGSLFDRQPQSNTGNVFRMENDAEPVLGYFSASGVSEKRLFIDRTELPRDVNVGLAYTNDCFTRADTLTKERETDQDVFNAILSGRKFYDFIRDANLGILGWVLVPCECYDCKELGGTTEIPDFWPQ
ncbi:MAG: DUF4249 domain-containing protein [Bacteroidota bacterium]